MKLCYFFFVLLHVSSSCMIYAVKQNKNQISDRQQEFMRYYQHQQKLEVHNRKVLQVVRELQLRYRWSHL